MASWTLQQLKESIYVLSAQCCGHKVVLDGERLAGLIEKHGPDAEWTPIAERAICQHCRKRLGFVLSMRPGTPQDGYMARNGLGGRAG